MSSHEWSALYRLIKREARHLPRPRRRFTDSDALVLALFFWSVGHDRPQCWACQRSHFYGPFRPRRLPSVAELNRRIRSARFVTLLETVYRALAPAPGPGGTCLLDARPLPVGACSKDHAARPGRVYAGFARGYRVHALVDEAGRVFAWRLTAMNVKEANVAADLLPAVPRGGTVLCDGGYDCAHLYEQAAQQHVPWLARPQRNAGRGHRQQSPARLAGIAQWQAHAEEYTCRRAQVERVFGWQCSFGGGLAPLPAWVRTPARVTRWVSAKLTIYHNRRREKCTAA